MELHTGTQLEDPLGLVGIVHLPFRGKARNEHGGLVERREIPGRERIIHRDAGEAIAFEALVGLAVGAGNVRRRHADAQQLFLRARKTCHGREGKAGKQASPKNSGLH